ncbi:hypothetical protein [Arthrobacter sp. MMS18-M83]|uniref:hypothetical protein n=1 Tax=Arthrobacter sp. MMS18-M83 TaxID=2996261 RepID=UPI00227D7005|nr:hypothetical protein [Arthrobacter sp. MMS18-M83]WAH95285.1 hypothetical protein OW521_12520 [Arthrobacter sp. MMS18-M83]
MISPLLIVISAIIAAAAVALASRFARWPAANLVAAAAGTLVAVIAWRVLANILLLNEDFMPAVSVGDAVCLIAGGLPPAVVAVLDRSLPRKAAPVLAGALVAFIVNVVIL